VSALSPEQGRAEVANKWAPCYSVGQHGQREFEPFQNLNAQINSNSSKY
jgi:hypothetical protein